MALQTEIDTENIEVGYINIILLTTSISATLYSVISVEIPILQIIIYCEGSKHVYMYTF